MNKLLLLTTIAIGLFSCSSDEDNFQNNPNNSTSNQNVVVYGCGYNTASGSGFSFNSNTTTLNYFDSKTSDAKIFKKGTDIYISAMKEVNSSSSTPKKIGYYKNGTFVEVGTGFSVRNIFVDNSDNVYLCGTNALYYPCYWKNNQMTTLVNKQGKASDMEIIGNDVYVSGTYFYNNTTYIIASWKNGVETTYGSLNLYNNQILPNTLIEVEGSDVYVYGSLSTGPKLWKNGQETTITFGFTAEEFKVINNVYYYVGRSWNGTNYCASAGNSPTAGSFSKLSNIESNIYDFKVVGQDIYYCGHENFKGTIWKNNTILRQEASYTLISDIIVE